MDKDYWNAVAEHYESEVFNVLADDKDSLVTKNIKHYGAKSKVAIDLGCGIGNFLPFLSKSFAKSTLSISQRSVFSKRVKIQKILRGLNTGVKTCLLQNIVSRRLILY